MPFFRKSGGAVTQCGIATGRVCQKKTPFSTDTTASHI